MEKSKKSRKISIMRAYGSPEKGENQVSRGESIPCLHTAPVSNDQCLIMSHNSVNVKFGIKVMNRCTCKVLSVWNSRTVYIHYLVKL